MRPPIVSGMEHRRHGMLHPSRSIPSSIRLGYQQRSMEPSPHLSQSHYSCSVRVQPQITQRHFSAKFDMPFHEVCRQSSSWTTIHHIDPSSSVPSSTISISPSNSSLAIAAPSMWWRRSGHSSSPGSVSPSRAWSRISPPRGSSIARFSL